MSKALPITAIVGRANVGKSSLFNRLVASRQAIVADEAGTTRDPVYGMVDTPRGAFWAVDTAGLKSPDDEFEMSIQDQILEAADAADVIMVVVEAHLQVNEEDRRVAKMALKSKKPVILVLNKADKTHGKELEHWRKLGIKDILETSAVHNSGIEELINEIALHIPKRKNTRPSKTTKIALLGRPNVGKSMLFNALGNKQQALVANVAGTTRDVNRVDIRFHNKDYEILDTAGIRRPGKIERGVEKFSVLRSISSIEEADVCLLLIDANEHSVHLDQKIAGMIKEAGKGLILVVSKWDSIDKDAYTQVEMQRRITHEYQFVNWAPLIFTSAETGKNVSKLFELVEEIAKNRKTEISTSVLNNWLAHSTSNHPPAGLKNTQPKLRYITQSGTQPPLFRIFGKDTRWLHWSYKRYLEKELRRSFGLEGTTVKMIFTDNISEDRKK